MSARSAPPSDRKPWNKTHHMHKTPRPDGGDAFLHDPGSGPALAKDDLAEMVAEEYLASAISGEEVMYSDRDQVTPDEYGGPYTEEVIPPELLGPDKK